VPPVSLSPAQTGMFLLLLLLLSYAHSHHTHTHTHTHTHYRCGKTSLFRIIRKLWPLVTGTIRMPSDKDIYFLSQVAFVPQGTLRDLVRWPLCGCVWSDGSCVVGSQLCGQILFHTPMHARAQRERERERERGRETWYVCMCLYTHILRDMVEAHPRSLFLY